MEIDVRKRDWSALCASSIKSIVHITGIRMHGTRLDIICQRIRTAEIIHFQHQALGAEWNRNRRMTECCDSKTMTDYSQFRKTRNLVDRECEIWNLSVCLDWIFYFWVRQCNQHLNDNDIAITNRDTESGKKVNHKKNNIRQNVIVCWR